jgi:rubrerythrin
MSEQYVAGTANATYDGVAVLYHALQAGAQYNDYIRDAEAEGDNEMADFFRQCQQEDASRADRLKQLLNTRLATV